MSPTNTAANTKYEGTPQERANLLITGIQARKARSLASVREAIEHGPALEVHKPTFHLAEISGEGSHALPESVQRLAAAAMHPELKGRISVQEAKTVNAPKHGPALTEAEPALTPG